MEEHFNVALFLLSTTSDYTIDFFFYSLSLLLVVPAIGAVITIYLGSLFHYGSAAGKPGEKVQCFMIYGGYLTCAY